MDYRWKVDVIADVIIDEITDVIIDVIAVVIIDEIEDVLIDVIS